MLASFQFVLISITCSHILRKLYFKELELYLREAILESNRVMLLTLLILFDCVMYLFLFKTIYMMRFFEIDLKIIFWSSGRRKGISRLFWSFVLKIVVFCYLKYTSVKVIPLEIPFYGELKINDNVWRV